MKSGGRIGWKDTIKPLILIHTVFTVCWSKQSPDSETQSSLWSCCSSVETSERYEPRKVRHSFMIAVLCFFLRSRNDRQELLTSLTLPDKVAQTLHQLLRPGKGGPVGGTSDWLTVAESQREELLSSCCQELDPIPVRRSQLSITIAWAATKSICCTRQLLTLSTPPSPSPPSPPPQQCHLIELYKHPSLSSSSYKYLFCALFLFCFVLFFQIWTNFSQTWAQYIRTDLKRTRVRTGHYTEKKLVAKKESIPLWTHICKTWWEYGNDSLSSNTSCY